MATKRAFANPFYALLLVVGVAFLLTATPTTSSKA